MEIGEPLEQKVSQLLYEEWDPIGLQHFGVQNQYQRYAKGLIEAGLTANSEEAIFEYLLGVFRRIFGRDPDDLRQISQIARHAAALIFATCRDLDCSKMENMQELYSLFFITFDLPDYFSGNLDSLDEILNDEALVADRILVIRFFNAKDFLKSENQERRFAIFEILANARNTWNNIGENPIKRLSFGVDDPSSELARMLM